MNSAESRRSLPGQRGAATLVITVLLLFSLSLMMLYAARVGVTEQRLAANDAQARTAFAAAQAGLDRALAGLATLDRAALDYDADGWVALAPVSATLANGADYRAEVHNRALVPHDANLLRLDVRASSGPGGGVRAATQLAVFAPLLPNVPPAPLVVRGDLSPAGDLMLASPERPVGAWIGGAHVPGGIVDAQLSEPASCPPLGICAGDDRIGALTPAAFFENTFGRPLEALRSAAQVVRCAACDPAAIIPTGTVLWLENDGATVTLGAGALGTEEQPVVAVIAGDFEAAGALQIHGLLFVLGDWRAGGGTLAAEGAVIVAGSAIDTDPAQLDYHAGILDVLHQSGRYAAVPGSWTDF